MQLRFSDVLEREKIPEIHAGCKPCIECMSHVIASLVHRNLQIRTVCSIGL